MEPTGIPVYAYCTVGDEYNENYKTGLFKTDILKASLPSQSPSSHPFIHLHLIHSFN